MHGGHGGQGREGGREKLGENQILTLCGRCSPRPGHAPAFFSGAAGSGIKSTRPPGSGTPRTCPPRHPRRTWTRGLRTPHTVSPCRSAPSRSLPSRGPRCYSCMRRPYWNDYDETADWGPADVKSGGQWQWEPSWGRCLYWTWRVGRTR